MLLCGAVVWCDRGLRDDLYQQQWSCIDPPVCSSVTTLLLLLFTNLAACRQYGCVLFLAFAIKRDDFGQGALEGGYQMGRHELRRGPNPIYIILPLPKVP